MINRYWAKVHGWLWFALPLVAAAQLVCACSARAVDRDRSYTRLKLAEDFLSRQQLEAAEKEAERALAFHAGNEEAQNVLGLVDLLRGLAAYRLLEVDDCLSGLDAEVLRKELDEHLLGAQEHFRLATEIAPGYGEAWSNRGVVALQLKKFSDAVRYFSEALSLPARTNNLALTRGHLGWAHFHMANYIKAAKELRQSIQLQPGMCVSTYRLGRVYFARKEWENALDKFKEVADQSDCPIQEAHLFLMKTYVELGMKGKISAVRDSCSALAAKSCVAAQCRSIGE